MSVIEEKLKLISKGDKNPNFIKINDNGAQIWIYYNLEPVNFSFPKTKRKNAKEEFERLKAKLNMSIIDD